MAVIVSKGIRVPSYAPELFDNFAANDWNTIIWACQTGNVPDTWTVGSQKPMPINGTSYPIDIIGLGHDDYADGSGKAPITFQMHDCYGTTYPMHTSYNPGYNGYGWDGCRIRTTSLPSILATMPSEVQSGIREVNKLTGAGSQSSTIVTTADTLFLLSEREVFGTATYSASGEGNRYAYYSAGNSVIKSGTGNAASFWWLRSPTISTTTDFCIVENSTGAVSYYPTIHSLGVAFAFCF